MTESAEKAYVAFPSDNRYTSAMGSGSPRTLAGGQRKTIG